MQNPSTILNTKRADLSNFLIHLTKNGSYSKYFSSKKGGYYYIKTIVQAEDSLKEIITHSKIEARSPYGYFKLKISTPNNEEILAPDILKAVCFSEAPLSEIKYFYKKTQHKRNDYQKFGLVFWQEKIKARGGNPIFYFDSKRNDFIESLNQMLVCDIDKFNSMLHLYEGFGPFIGPMSGYSDFRWEREWRKKDDLIFEFSDLAFGLCPYDKINELETLTQKKIPFIDPDWDSEAIARHFKNFGANNLLEYFN